jgi:hypothetical protein
MSNSTRRWLKGIIRSFVKGGSGALSAGTGAAFIDPDKFNPVTQTGHFLELAATTFIVSGAHEMMSYLKDNPVPDDGTQFITKQNNP